MYRITFSFISWSFLCYVVIISISLPEWVKFFFPFYLGISNLAVPFLYKLSSVKTLVTILKLICLGGMTKLLTLNSSLFLKSPNFSQFMIS